ncbi:MAG TPA: carboxypeptidase regulatory-like domain-containing protein [Acidobacteriaceae bacterium]|nr:carboxypeptidase regulatory-like domain-containing protein [Acidobacteriaceae bacterium]
MRLRWVINAVLPGLLIAAAPALPQSDTGGSITGHVLAPTGRGVAGAAIHLEDPATGQHTDAFSDSRGSFFFADILPGDYRMRVHADGLSDWEADHLTIEAGGSVVLNAAPVSLTLHRTVLVDARRQLSESSVMSAADLSDLPNDTRHASALAAIFSPATPSDDGSLSFGGLSPLMNSITVDGVNGRLAFRARERATQSGTYVTGQSSISEFQMGGSFFGREPGGFSTVTKSGNSHMRGQATFFDRGSLGQTYNAYDKVMQQEPAGTTTVDGQPVQYLNGQPITYVEAPYHAPDRRQEWEISAGGPIRRDRLFWFFAWEQHLRHNPAVARASEPEVFFFPPSQPTLATLEARIGLSKSPIAQSCTRSGVPGGGSTATAACAWSTVLSQLNTMLGTVPRSTRQTIVFPKLTWRINDRHQLILQYNSMRRNAPHGALGGASENDGIGSFGNSASSDDTAVARWDYFLTPRLVNSARFQYSRDLLAQSPSAPTAFERQFAGNSWGLPAEISIDASAGFRFGTLPTVNKRAYPEETRQQFLDAASWLHGKQALRFGYDYNHISDTIEGVNGENGAYSYSTLLDFLSDLLAANSCDGTTAGAGPYPCYTRYRQTLGYTNWWLRTADYAAFAAEEWKPARRLTLTVGLRYDYERLPDTNPALVNADVPQTARLPHNRDDFAPRAAFAWDLFGHGTTVLRGGFGLYFARVPNATVFSALTSTGSAHSPRSYSWRPLDAGAPPFPYVFGSNETPYVPAAAPNQASTAPDVVFFDPRFRHAQINQAQLSLEQSVGARTVLTATAMATDGHHLAPFIDANIDTSATADVFYTVKAPGNNSNFGPLAKLASAMNGSSFPIYMPQHFYFQRVNPAYGSITDIVSETNSSYRGLMLRVIRRMARGLTANVGYTLAQAIDDGQNEAAFADRNDVYDPADLRLEHGTSNYDVRQRISGAVVLRETWRLRGAAGEIFGGYSLAATGDWRTGLPYSMRTAGSVPTPSCSYTDWLIAGGPNGGAKCLQAVTQPNGYIPGTRVPIAALGASLNGSGGEDFIPGIGRNTFRYPGSSNLDVRLTKRFPLSDRFSFDLFGEAFNALNHQSVTRIQTVGYRISNDSSHANMATLTWQSGERPAPAVTMVNGTSVRQYAYDATAAFGNPTNAASTEFQRERQIQAGVRLNF